MSAATSSLRTRTRRLALWVPDWPVVAALRDKNLPATTPAAVMRGHRVMVTSTAARAQGVTRGMRQRRAQRLCPDLICLPPSQAPVQQFEAVAQAVEQVVTGIEITRPGLITASAAGAARFHGSEEAVAQELLEAVAGRTGHECLVGIAEGLLGAVMAARTSSIVPRGASAAFLGPFPLSSLTTVAIESRHSAHIAELVDMATRLGLRTLGDFAALTRADVSARWGHAGTWAWHMARAQDLTTPVARIVTEQVWAEHEWDEPAQHTSQLLAVAPMLAEQLAQRLQDINARCAKVRISACTVQGEVWERVWRTDAATQAGTLVPHMTDRVRWQLEGWLSGTASGPQAGHLRSLRVEAEDIIPVGAEHPYLWGVTDRHGAALRSIDRLQGMVGLDGVLGAHLQGGRTPRDKAVTLPWGQLPHVRPLDRPWPGEIPGPLPATVLDEPEPIHVVDAGGREVQVGARLGVSAPPTWVRRVRPGAPQQWGPPVAVEAWAGPWPVIEQWWTPELTKRAYFQISFADAPALLVSTGQRQWRVEAVYD